MEENTTPKRTYQKHKTDKKVSVVHFLNKKVKAKLIEDIPSYPLYFRLNYNRTNTTIKSIILGYFNENSLKEDSTKVLINVESNFLSTCYHSLKSFDPDYGFTQFNEFYKELSKIILDNYEPMGSTTAINNIKSLCEGDDELKEVLLNFYINQVRNNKNNYDFYGYVSAYLMTFEDIFKDPELLSFDPKKFLKLASIQMQKFKAEIISKKEGQI